MTKNTKLKEEKEIKDFFENYGITNIDFISKNSSENFINISLYDGNVLIISRFVLIRDKSFFEYYVDVNNNFHLYQENVENVLKAMKLLNLSYKTFQFQSAIDISDELKLLNKELKKNE